MTEVRLDELLAPGVAADDVPELAPLLQARPLYLSAGGRCHSNRYYLFALFFQQLLRR